MLTHKEQTGEMFYRSFMEHDKATSQCIMTTHIPTDVWIWLSVGRRGVRTVSPQEETTSRLWLPRTWIELTTWTATVCHTHQHISTSHRAMPQTIVQCHRDQCSVTATSAMLQILVQWVTLSFRNTIVLHQSVTPHNRLNT